MLFDEFYNSELCKILGNIAEAVANFVVNNFFFVQNQDTGKLKQRSQMS